VGGALRRSLLVSPYFPPVGVSGTKRALHLSRQLSAYGWEPVILTGGAIGEPIDESLSSCVPPQLTVSRGYSGALRPWLEARKQLKQQRRASLRGDSERAVSSSGPSLMARLKPKHLPYWLPFDRYWLDRRAGYREMTRLVREHALELIHVSADPWAPLAVAERVSRELDVPLVVDFRDPWSVHEGKMALRPRLTQAWIRAFEERLFKQSAAVILNTETARDVYIERYRGRVEASRFYAVRNAFDRGLFESLPTPIERGAHAAGEGTFTALYFGRFRAFVSPERLFEAFARFVEGRSLSPERAQLEVVGGLSSEHLELAERCGVREHLKLSPSVPFRACLPTLQGASVLLLVIEPECYMQIPGKLYDYFAAARPIIALSANQEANRMITEVKMGSAVDHSDLEAITAALDLHYQRWSEGLEPAHEELEGLVEPYSARAQARAISEIYERACEGRS